MKSVYGTIENVENEWVIKTSKKGFLLDYDNIFDLSPDMPVYVDSYLGENITLSKEDTRLATARNVVQSTMELMGMFNPTMSESNVNMASKWLLRKLNGGHIESFVYNVELARRSNENDEFDTIIGTHGITANQDSAYLMYSEINDFLEE